MSHPLATPNVLGRTYLTGRWVALDVETTNKEFGNPLLPENRIVMVSWQKGQGDKHGKLHHYYGNIAECREFWDALGWADFLVAHNAKFEMHWLWNLGYDPTDKLWYDTMLAEWVRLGNNHRKLRYNLDAMAARYKEARKETQVDTLMKGGVCPSEIPESQLVARCRRDVHSTARIMCKQRAVLARRKQLPLVAHRCLTAGVLCAIERNGLTLDRERVHAEYEKYSKEYKDLAAKFRDFTGGVNFNSGPQMTTFLYGRWPLVEQVEGKGKSRVVTMRAMTEEERAASPIKPLNFRELTDARGNPKRGRPCKQFPDGVGKKRKQVLEQLKGAARTKRQREFFEMSERLGKTHALLSKNLEFFKGVVDERGGKFYAEIRQCTTATHRLSGAGRPQQFKQFPDGTKSMQTQNSPREFKRLYCSHDPDYWATDADAAQLEFRVAAFLGQDKQAMADIRNPNFDAHIQTACVMHDPTFEGELNAELYAELLAIYRDESHPRYKEVKGWRQDAKPDTYKPLYGGERGTPLQERYYQWFQRRYAGIYAEASRWLNIVEGDKQLTTCTGLRFFWEFYYRNEIPMDASKHKPIKPQVFNYPVQYLATGEIVLIALIYLYYRVQKAGLRVVFTNTVHDSVSANVHKDDMAAYKSLVVQAFTKDTFAYLTRVYGIVFNVPLGCELKWGTHLGEGETFSIDVDPLKEERSSE